MQLKHGFFAVFAALSLVMLWGCSSPTLTVNGKTYRVLSADEEKQLVRDARLLLGRPGKALNKEEVRFVQKTEPEVTIHYTGDRTGDAKIVWKTSEKIITMHFGGELLSDTMGWTFETEKRVPEVLKFIPAPK